MMWIAIFTVFLFIGYFIYGKMLEKNWQIDIYRDQSDWQEDESIISHFGLRYVQLAQFALLLSFEILISVVFGYVFGIAYIFWLIFGTIFFGGVLSYYGGMYALRNHGYTFNYYIKEKLGSFVHACTTLLFLSLIAVLLSDSYKSFSLVYEKIFNLPPNLLLIYCSVVAVFCCFCTARQLTMIFTGIGAFAIIVMGLLFFGSKLQLNFVEYGAENFVLSELKYAYPLAFFVITLGSVNCLQGLQASLIAPMVKNEKVGRRVFFGASVFQAFFLIIGSALVAAWNPNIRDFYFSLFDNDTQYTVLQNISYSIGGKKATLLLFALAITLFLGFVGSMARLARNLIAETIVGKVKFLSGVITLLVVIMPVFWLKQFSLKFEYVLIVTQLAGLLCCAVLISFLRAAGKKYYHLVWPSLLVFGALISYVLLVLLDSRLLLCYACGLAPLFVCAFVYILSNKKETLREKCKLYKERVILMREFFANKLAKFKTYREKQKKISAQNKARKELQKTEAKNKKLEERKQKAQEAENKKKASLSLMIEQDQTAGKEKRELELEKELANLREEREKIDLLLKEKESELEKEQSKRLLLETSENVIEMVQNAEENEIEEDLQKIDSVLLDTEDFGLDNLIEEKETDSEEKIETELNFSFDDDDKTDFEFEKTAVNPARDSAKEQPNQQNKKKNKNKNKNKKGENKKLN